MKTGFSLQSVNLLAAPKGTDLNYRSAPFTTASVLHNSKHGFSAGRTSGDYYIMTDGKWWSVVLNSNGAIAYVREDVTIFIKPTSNPTTITDATAQSLINDLVKSDVEIFHSLLRSNSLLVKAEGKGLNVSTLKTKYIGLLSRLNYRQEKVKTSKMLSFQTGLKKGYESLVQAFNDNLTNPVYYPRIIGIGSVTAVVIGAVIGAGLAVGIYFAFKPSYSESKADLVVSADLEKALSTLTPAQAQAVKTDLESQVDKAYNQGATDGTFSGIAKLLKPALYVIGGYLLVSTVLSHSKNKNKK